MGATWNTTLIFFRDVARSGLRPYGRAFNILLTLCLLLFFKLSLVLVLEHDLFFVCVVAGYSLNLGIWWHFQLVLSVCIKEFSFLLKHLLDRLAHIIIKLLD